jgi:hypothetical protein
MLSRRNIHPELNVVAFVADGVGRLASEWDLLQGAIAGSEQGPSMVRHRGQARIDNVLGQARAWCPACPGPCTPPPRRPPRRCRAPTAWNKNPKSITLERGSTNG